MPHPNVRQLPPAPQRGEDFETFTEKANDHVAALTPWTGDVNELADWMEVTADEVEQSAGGAGGSAFAAADSAGEAADSATASSQSADLSMDWATSLTEVESGLKGARGYAQDAESAVAALPEGTIADDVVAPDKVWSSEKTNGLLGDIGSILDEINGASV